METNKKYQSKGCLFSYSLAKQNRVVLKTIYVVSIFLCSINVNAQVSSPPIDAYINLGNESALIYLEVSDTTNVSEIQAILSSQQGESIIFDNTFTFDQSSGLQNGMTYSRIGNGISLGTGTIPVSPVIFTKIRLKNSSNNWSEWFEFVSN